MKVLLARTLGVLLSIGLFVMINKGIYDLDGWRSVLEFWALLFSFVALISLLNWIINNWSKR